MIYFWGNIIYRQPVHYILLLMFLGTIGWSILNNIFVKCLVKKNEWKMINIFLLSVGIIIIVVLTIISRKEINREIYLIPFHFILEARIQPELYRSMLMNVFLFFPLGLSLPYALPEKWKHPVLSAILFACALSVSIEFTQYYFHLGRAETDDVICNTLGCTIGTISFWLSNRRKLKEKTPYRE